LNFYFFQDEKKIIPSSGKAFKIKKKEKKEKEQEQEREEIKDLDEEIEDETDEKNEKRISDDFVKLLSHYDSSIN
jgi:hypothetical protein